MKIKNVMDFISKNETPQRQNVKIVILFDMGINMKINQIQVIIFP